jgi:alkaline phosphatase D
MTRRATLLLDPVSPFSIRPMHLLALDTPGCSRITRQICCVFFIATSAMASADGPFLSNGVKIGDVDQHSVVLWTRLGSSKSYDPVTYAIPASGGQIKIDYRIQGTDQVKSTGWRDLTPADDSTFKTRLDDLEDGTRYQINLRARGGPDQPDSDSLQASFATAPSIETAAPVQFVIMTCQKFLDLDDGENGFLTYKTLAGMKLDFASHTGDAVYYDQEPLLAKNAADARTHWHRMYSLPNVRTFNTRVPVFMIKDDHDTLKDDCYRGQSYGELTFESGVEIHRQQNPVGASPYRTVRWGEDLQVWFVEGREFRSKNSEPDGPMKTILGAEQIRWLKRSVAESDATFKIYVSATPLVGPDREKKSDNHSNSNFQYEGRWLRAFLAEHDVISINGDRHWQYVSRDGTTGLWEFGTGPVLDARAQGWKQDDKRPEHRFLRVAGGFLLGNVDREGDQVTLTLSHHDVNGAETHRETFSRDVP